MSSTASPSLGSLAEVRLATAVMGVIALTAALHVSDAPVAPAVIAQAALVVVVARRLPLHLALLLALAAWGFLTGFVVNDLGVLTVGGGDVERLAVLVVLGAGAAALGVAAPSRSRPVPSGSRQDPGPDPRPGVPWIHDHSRRTGAST